MIQRASRVVLSLGLVTACTGDEGLPFDPAEVQVSVQEVRAVSDGQQGYLSLDVLTTAPGHAVACNQGHLRVSVGVGDSADGPFAELPTDSYQIRCSTDENPNVALVVDNSASEDGFLPWLQEAAHVMTDAIFARDGRASVVRISTDSSIELALTGDEEMVRGAIDELYIRNGWTALYDGIRMGNETLGSVGASTAPGDMDDACAPDRKLAIVTFTDGNENNSANERLRSPEYPGDGIDTTLADLHGLAVDGVVTPIYTVGMGEMVDHAALEDLAATTGGRHHRVDTAEELPGVYELISDYLASSVNVCTELPDDFCGDHFVRVEYVWSPCDEDETCDPEEETRGSYLQEIHVECPPAPRTGNVATVLLTLSNPGIERSVAQTLATNTVAWVSPVESPQVLVVKDENHHGEFAQDAEYVHEILTEAGVTADFIDEPAGGLELADVDGYDVIWLSNPGYPFNDRRSLYTLADFAAAGGGYVLQSDDGTWLFNDSAFSMSSFTGLVHGANGTSFCGQHIDNNASSYRYQVTFNDDTHPAIAGLEATTFYYGDDIDTSAPAGLGETVLAWAEGVNANGAAICETRVPVISVHAP
jgi:hypothetical protein